MLSIKAINKANKEILEELLDVLHESFKTVAVEFNLNKNNTPTNGAFISKKHLEELIEKGLMLFGCFENERIVGCVGIKQSNKKDEYYLEKLCVLPKKRHSGIGFDLLQYGQNEIKNRDGKIIAIGIINENKQLKEWYIKNGFQEYEISSFEHLPFEVCIMKKEI